MKKKKLNWRDILGLGLAAIFALIAVINFITPLTGNWLDITSFMAFLVATPLSHLYLLLGSIFQPDFIPQAEPFFVTAPINILLWTLFAHWTYLKKKQDIFLVVFGLNVFLLIASVLLIIALFSLVVPY